jgi:GDP/UDP-N,N'-diacetylbacillosamine 2-epimerase (hydrolysing)
VRKVSYVTGTRADFGLMKNTLLAIQQHSLLSLGVLVTGMHLLPAYGETWREIEASGIAITAKVPVNLTGGSGTEMAHALGMQVVGFTQALTNDRPDMLMLLGDRGEMLAGAIAAIHLNIPIIHIHGGELSGTVDESIRHAISKLSHYHFASTTKSRERLIRMGEKAEQIFVTGAPGLDEIHQTVLLDRPTLFNAFGLDQSQAFVLVLFHPVVQQAGQAAAQTRALMDAVFKTAVQSLVIMPNADAGGHDIAQVIKEYGAAEKFITAIHVKRREFLSLLAYAQVMIGNSSSGIIEAASLGTPVVNIGDRQNNRERNSNVIDVTAVESDILSGIKKALSMKGQQWENVYGDGTASNRITDSLMTISLDSRILEKVNAY